jgi:hypothetical protein
MMNKTLVVLVSALILIVALITVFNYSSETDTDPIIQGDNTVTDDDVINEIDTTLLDEEGEVDIGDMI